jgi:hypothetical protein
VRSFDRRHSGGRIFATPIRAHRCPSRRATAGHATPRLPAHLRRQVVEFRPTEAAGTIIVDTPNT